MARKMVPGAAILLTVLLVGTPAGAGSPAEAALPASFREGPQGQFISGEVLVAFHAGVPQDRSEAARAELGATTIQTFQEIRLQRWKLPPSMSVSDAVRRLATNPGVRYAEPNYVVNALAIPNDPLRNDLWGLHNLGQTGGTNDADIDALEAWDVQTGSSSIVVGVVDTGIDYTHEDLAGNIWTNPGEDLDGNGVVDPTDFNGVDDDANGKIDDLRGWDCRNEDNDPMDDHNHGTHVAGTIGARGNNGIGVVGVSWNVKLMPLKFLGTGGSGSTTDAIECINYAASFVDANGNKIVRVTSNSWGGGRRSKALQDAIAKSGALFVAAAGNSGSSSKMYPAGYDLDNIISVAATDHNDALASFSNFGSDWVDLGAPGVGVLSSIRNNGYQSFSGTSMATPHASGVAALLMAHFPAMTNAEVKTAILNTVDPLPSLQGKTVTGGRLNAARALGAAEMPADTVAPAAITNLAGDTTRTTQTSLTVTWTATGDAGTDGTAYLYDIRHSKDPITDANWDLATKASREPIPLASGTAEAFTVTGLSPGTTYYLALKAADEAGGFSGLSNVATGSTAPSPWEVQIVDGQAFNYVSALAYDPLGNPTVAYTIDTDGSGWWDTVKYAQWNGASWEIEVVDAGSSGWASGLDLDYDPADGRPSLSYVLQDTLRFAHKAGTMWNVQEIQRNVQGDSTSLAYDPRDGFPSISYRLFSGRGAGLKLAHWTGTSWITETVEAGAAARYSSLGFDPAGNPTIAYSAYIDDGSNLLNTLKFARLTGVSWEIQIVETGSRGYGVKARLAYDPVTGYPAIVHSAWDTVRLARWNGAIWTAQAVELGNHASLAFDILGVPHVAYGSSGEVRIARWDGTSWLTEVADFNFNIGWRTNLAFDPSGKASLSYAGDSADGSFRGVKFALRA